MLLLSFNGYLLLGHYLRKLDWSLSKTLAIGIPMFVVGYAITFFGFRYISSLPEYTDEMYELFFTYCSINVVMMTIPVFMLAKKVQIRSEKVQKALANLTLCGFWRLYGALLPDRVERRVGTCPQCTRPGSDSGSGSDCFCRIMAYRLGDLPLLRKESKIYCGIE